MSPSTFFKQLQEINIKEQCLFLFNRLWNIEQLNHGKSTFIYSEQRQNIFNRLSKQTHITSIFLMKKKETLKIFNLGSVEGNFNKQQTYEGKLGVF